MTRSEAKKKVRPALAYGWKLFMADLEAKKLVAMLSKDRLRLRDVPPEVATALKAFRTLSQYERHRLCLSWIGVAVMGPPFVSSGQCAEWES